MGKYTPQFKQEVLDSIQSIGLKNTVKKYCAQHPIRPEIIRIWADPSKLQKWRHKACNYYRERVHNETFLETRRLRSKNNYQQIKSARLLNYHYTKKQMISQFDKIKLEPGRFDAEPNMNRIILTYQPHFYEIENNLWQDKEIQEKLLLNREKYLFKSRETINTKEILRGFKISGIHIGFSHFSPLWIKAFIKKYQIKSLYDPCGGWGHRLLGAHDIQYIYNDKDLRTYEGIRCIAKDFNINAVFYNQDAAILTPIEEYEAVFTCPPYFNAEIYNNIPFLNLTEYKQWWFNVIKSSIKPTTKYFAFVINNDFKQDLMNITLHSGLRFIEEIPVGRNRLNHFQRVSKNKQKGEFLLVFTTFKESDLSLELTK